MHVSSWVWVLFALMGLARKRPRSTASSARTISAARSDPPLGGVVECRLDRAQPGVRPRHPPALRQGSGAHLPDCLSAREIPLGGRRIINKKNLHRDPDPTRAAASGPLLGRTWGPGRARRLDLG